MSTPPARPPGPIGAALRAPATGAGRQEPPSNGAVPGTDHGDDGSLNANLSVLLDRARRRITVRGEFDVAAAPMVADALAVLPSAPDDVTIDLTGVRFIDAAGLGCLVACANLVAARGAKLVLVGASAQVQRVFDIAQLAGMLRAS